MTLMKKFLLLFTLILSLQSKAQLEKGARLAGLQTNLIIGDIYATTPDLYFSQNTKRYGLNLVPTLGWAVQRNWIIGGQATLGFWHERSVPLYSPGVNYQADNYYDLGIAPFTRLYLDISRNKKWKGYGLASIELATVQHAYKTSYQNGTSQTTKNSFVDLRGSLGLGLAYFGARMSIDLNAAITGLRLGVYKTIAPGKKIF